MKYTAADWAEKKKRGIARFLMIEGILYTGGPFAVVMQIIGVFLLRDEGQTFGQYFSSTKTWMTFLAHGTLFGLIMGFINWWRNEKNAASGNP
jgi:uncharacterized membrane protein